MSWTYTDPNTSDRDKIRFLIGDTDSTDPLLSDEEIAFTLTEAGGSVYQAGHDSCYAIAAKFSRMKVDENGFKTLSMQGQRIRNAATNGSTKTLDTSEDFGCSDQFVGRPKWPLAAQQGFVRKDRVIMSPHDGLIRHMQLGDRFRELPLCRGQVFEH